MDIETIKEGLKRPGKTQKGLASAIGVDPAAISRLLAKTRKLKADEVERARAYLFDDEISSDRNVIRLRTVGNTAHVPQQGDLSLLKVLGMAEAGADGWSLWNGDIIQYIPRPANLVGALNAYAVYVRGGSMEPRYTAGDLVHVHPDKPVTPGSHVLVQRKPASDGESPRAIIKKLVRRSGSKVVLEQYEPAGTFELRADEIVSMHRIVGSSEA